MVLTGGEELRLALMFSQIDRKDDPDNHVVPVLDTFLDDDDPNTTYMVMPLLRSIDMPPFDYVVEVVDFVDQMLKVCSLSYCSSCTENMSGVGISTPSRRCSSVRCCHRAFALTYLRSQRLR